MMGEEKEHDRVQDSLKMLDYGYQAYTSVRLFHAGQALATPRVYKGTATQVKAGVAADQFVTLPRGAADNFKTSVTLNEPVLAPLAAGQQIGEAKVLAADGKTLATVPVVALEAVPEASALGRLWDSLLLAFQKK